MIKRFLSLIISMIMILSILSVNITQVAATENTALSYDAAVAYKSIIDEKLNKYGYFNSSSYFGVGLVKLIDFDNDGSSELLIGYADKKRCIFEVYRYDDTLYRLANVDCSSPYDVIADMSIGIMDNKMYTATWRYGSFDSYLFLGTVANNSWKVTTIYSGPAVYGDPFGDYIAEKNGELISANEYSDICEIVAGFETIEFNLDRTNNEIYYINNIVSKFKADNSLNLLESSASVIRAVEVQDTGIEIKINVLSEYNVTEQNIAKTAKNLLESEYGFDVIEVLYDSGNIIINYPSDQIYLTNTGSAAACNYRYKISETFFSCDFIDAIDERIEGKNVDDLVHYSFIKEYKKDYNYHQTIIWDYSNTQKENKSVTVTIDEKEINFDQPPIIVNSRTLVPVRAVVEAMGGDVSWDDVTERATLILGEDIIKLTIDNTTAYLNDEAKIVDVAPQIINSRTLMPIRFVAESFGYQVDWDEATQTVLIKRMVSSEEESKNTLAIAAFTEFLNDFQQKPIEIQAMPNNLILTDDNYITTTLEILLYEFFDIDMDGQTELIVSGKILSPDYNMGGSCFSAWDINEKNEIVKIFAKAGMNSRTTWRYNFLENNGEIFLCESSGMSNSVSRVTHRILYKIKDREIVPYLSVDYDNSSDYYAINDQPVSAEEALNMVEEIDHYNRPIMQVFE